MQLIKMAFRTFRRNRVFTTINVVGLALGITVFLLIAEFVASEWSANRMHANFNELYRVVTVSKEGNSYYQAPGYAARVKEQFPEIRSIVKVAEGLGGGVISAGAAGETERVFREQDMLYVDGNFLEVFSFPVIKGGQSLKQPKTLALTSTMAKKIFDSEDVVGKTVMVSNQFGKTVYTVASVITDIPGNSDLKANVLLSIHTLESAANRDDNDWADPNTTENAFVNLYCLLNKDASPKALSKKITDYVHSLQPGSAEASIALQPFRYLHLGQGLDYPFQTFGSLKLVYMLMLIGVLILVIAWVNYVNLSTVQALKRAKESGVRKVLGASRRQLAIQFLSETFLLTLISVVLAVFLVQLMQPLFNRFTGKDLDLLVLANGQSLLIALAVIVAGSFLSGGYVAFVLSSFKPISTLRGKIQSYSIKGIFLRKGLVVFQFAVSIVFIIATIILYRQLAFLRNEPLGMKLEELLVIQGPTVSSEGQAAKNMSFKSELKNLAFVKKLAASNNVPGRGYNFSADGITNLVPIKGDDKKSYNMFIADQEFFNTYGISFKEGGSYSENDAIMSWNNAKKVVLNEEAVKQLGLGNGPVTGKRIKWGDEYEIAGVVKNYHHLSLRSVIEPVIYLPSVSFVYFTIQTDAANMPEKIRTIEKLYKKTFPGNPFEYFFADDAFDQQYRQEQDLGNIFIAAALVAIFIACLGLFGLAAFTAQQRVKEIGVRKVLGASVTDITTLLSKDFIKLVLLAILIGSPLAWWAMSSWLQDFPFRTSIEWWVFVAAGVAAIAIALATISFQAINAAKMNPVISLRTE
jgi:putative ABC transport system permease protein